MLDEVLSLFCKGDRVVIRSRRRLLVKSGDTAGIDVGHEVPVVTRISDSEQVGGTTNVLPEISYRKTGVQIEIKPLVQANGLVDSGDLSAAQRGTVVRGHEPRRLPDHSEPPDQHQPHPRGRGISPDGELISGSRSAVETGVPVLGRLPGIGRLFRTDAVQEDRTELMVMVTPYVIADHEEGGVHPADPGTARSVHATHVVMRAGGAILGPGTGSSHPPGGGRTA